MTMEKLFMISLILYIGFVHYKLTKYRDSNRWLKNTLAYYINRKK
jgi:hypothetical protein